MGSTEASSSSSWRVLEFYSGIGGMRYSLMQAMGNATVTVVEAFEINDKANDVYQFNFSSRPLQGNIQNLTSAELDKYGANAWLLSPPCQPYTRQGLQKDSADARASSFIKILELIPSMHQPPAVMFVENVVGFEISDTHNHLMEILAANNYSTQEFILSPIQFGIPYSRPRYFCLAKRKPLLFKAPSFNSQLIRTPIPLRVNGGGKPYHAISQENGSDLICRPIKDFLHTCHSICHPEDTEFKISRESTNYSENHLRDVQCESANPHVVEQIRDDCAVKNFLYSKRKNDVIDLLRQYAVPVNLIERWGSAMDIVFPDSNRCCCFTKSYYRYVKGTGSLLATVQPREKHEIGCLKDLRLRYFTPREVANLHSFPGDFDFPPHITLRQRYALLGNSLSVAVVAPLLQYLFEEPTQI